MNVVCYYVCLCFYFLDDCFLLLYKLKRWNDINLEIKLRVEVKNKDKRDIIMSSFKEDRRMMLFKLLKWVLRKCKSKIFIMNDNVIVEGGDKC